MGGWPGQDAPRWASPSPGYGLAAGPGGGMVASSSFPLQDRAVTDQTAETRKIKPDDIPR